MEWGRVGRTIARLMGYDGRSTMSQRLQANHGVRPYRPTPCPPSCPHPYSIPGWGIREAKNWGDINKIVCKTLAFFV